MRLNKPTTTGINAINVQNKSELGEVLAADKRIQAPKATSPRDIKYATTVSIIPSQSMFRRCERKDQCVGFVPGSPEDAQERRPTAAGLSEVFRQCQPKNRSRRSIIRSPVATPCGALGAVQIYVVARI
jgi:hypothetical protein